MANGKLLEAPVYRVAELAIGETCRLTDVEVAVLPSGARDILGLSALKRLGPFAMQMSPPQLWLSDCELRT
jgi:predicted aspartyl protease